MDLGRYVLQQDWVYTSVSEPCRGESSVSAQALKGYPAGHEPDFRVGGTDSGRRLDRELARESAYPCNASHRQIHDRDTHANSYRNHWFDRPARLSGRSDADFSPYGDGYGYRHHISRRRDDRYERYTHYGQSIYGSDSRVRVRDKQILSWERDPSPEHSLSRGRDDRQRSRSPRVHSWPWKENYDDMRNHEHSSTVPSATVKVMGLSSNTTEEDLYQILAHYKWRPICNVRVLKVKESSSCRGIAFIDFPSVVAARTMMEEVGYYGLVVDGRELSFEYGIKKIKTKKQIMHIKKRRHIRAKARAAVAASAQKQQQEEEKEVVEQEEGEVDDTELEEEEEEEEEEDTCVEEEGEVEDGGAGEGEAEVEKLLQGEVEVEELQQQQRHQVGEGELEIGEILHGPSSHGISASISCEELEEKMDCIKKDHHVRDKQILSWERDPSPEHSLSRGHDDCQRSRSPRVHSRTWKENYGDMRNHEHSSTVPSATVKVMGLSTNTTEEDLYQILAEWRPFCNVRVLKEKKSGSCRGFGFIEFPSVVAARTMMEKVGYDGLVDDGRLLSFEYSIKKIKSKKQVMHDKLSRKRRRHSAIARAAVAAPAQKQQQQTTTRRSRTTSRRGIGEILHGPSSHGISASISCEELQEKMDCIKKDPYLKAIVEDIEIGGPEVMMRYLSDPEVLQKLGHAFGFGVSESIVNLTEHNAPDDDEDKTCRG